MFFSADFSINYVQDQFQEASHARDPSDGRDWQLLI